MRIAEAFPELPIQVGGGIRDEDTVQAYLDAGVQYVIIGTKAVSAPISSPTCAWSFPATSSSAWTPRTARWPSTAGPSCPTTSVVDLAQRFEAMASSAIVYTDIGRDGMMKGVNVEATAELANASASR
jgi:phosphoribosylformimino-5-aminoimidazole carboxamide ribotide isomerase